MKTSFKLAIVAIAALIAVGCSNIEKILVKQEGVWNVTQFSFVEYTAETAPNYSYTDSTEFDLAPSTMTFMDDGTGTFTFNFLGQVEDFPLTWTATEDEFTLNINDVFDNPLVYTVNESSNDAQDYSLTEMGTETRGDTTATFDRMSTLQLSR